MTALTRGHIPLDELSEFSRFNSDIRDDVQAWLNVLSGVTKPIQLNLAAVAKRMGVSSKTARRKYDLWRKKGWRGLVDRRLQPAESGLPEAFKDHVRALAENNQRKFSPAYRALCLAWQRGDPIPGYDDVSGFERRVFPKGWTESNLRKACGIGADKFELTVTRVGMGAASAMAPQTFTTRVGLWPGAMLMLDDVWHDNFVMWRGKPVRVLQLSMLDVFSGCITAYGTKPRFERADGTMDQLKEAQTCFLIAQQLALHGYSPRGTTLLAEHGTAAVRERLEALLYDRSGGLIRTRRSGITGKEQAIAGMFDGRGGGNFRFKSPLESVHNLIHNELASLPGQTGMDVEHRPESLDGGVMRIGKDGAIHIGGLLSYATDIGRALEVLPAATAAKLRAPLLNYESEFRPTLRDVMEWINRRGEWSFFTHALEGWADCGHIVTEYRPTVSSNQWMTNSEFLALPAAEQGMLRALVQSNAEAYARTRSLSPREVWTSGRTELLTLPPSVIPEILLGGEKVTESDRAEERECRDGYFTFRDAELSLDLLRFSSRLHTPDGREEELKPDTYLTVLNPYQPEFLWVHDASGILLGLVKRDHRPCRADVEAVTRQHGEKAKRLAEQLLPIRARHIEKTRRAAADMDHNAEVIRGQDKQTERDRKEADDALAHFGR